MQAARQDIFSSYRQFCLSLLQASTPGIMAPKNSIIIDTDPGKYSQGALARHVVDFY